jgi:hypothetical protein
MMLLLLLLLLLSDDAVFVESLCCVQFMCAFLLLL